MPKLWYEAPAREWNEALPVGNGRLGAMVFGGVPRETYRLNEETVWLGNWRDRLNPKARDALPRVRRLLFMGKVTEAEQLAAESMLRLPPRLMSYQPLCDLCVNQPRRHFDIWACDYRRELDLTTGLALVTHSWNMIFTREVFASVVDNVIVVHYQVDKPGGLHLMARFDREVDMTGTAAGPDGLTLDGSLGPDMVSFRAQALVRHSGGEYRMRGNTVEVEGADTVTFVIAAASSFVNPRDLSGDPAARCSDTLARVRDKPYEALRADHVADHQAMMHRTSLHFGPDPRADMPTDRRLKTVAEGADDAHLAAQIGRASCRERV